MVARRSWPLPGGRPQPRPPRRQQTGHGLLTGLLAGCAALGVLAGCGTGQASPPAASGSSPSPSSATSVRQVQARLGQLVLADGYVREPASPDVAAAYLTILNTGDTAARLTGVHSDIAGLVMPMTETGSGSVGSMAPLGDVVVPAHGSFLFRPGAAHLMLEQLHQIPTTGGTVSLTLTFAPGGEVTVALPVTPIGNSEPSTSMPSMSTPSR